MTKCTSTIISKLSETMDYLLGTCMPKIEMQEDESREAERRPKDDNDRKEELKQLFGMFSSRAQNYIDCVKLSLETNEKQPSFYKLDSMLKTLTIKTNQVVQEIPISEIHEILNYDQIQSESYGDLRSNPIISNLTLQEKNRFVLIEYSDESGGDRKLTFLVEEVGNSDPLITVLRILKMYSDDQTKA